MEKVNVFWFRRDLRLGDNAGLYAALSSGIKVLPLFIFDSEILEKLPCKKDKKVSFIHSALDNLGIKLLCFYGKPQDALEWIASDKAINNFYRIDTVFCNEDYEPYATERDNMVSSMLAKKGIGFKIYKDNVVFSKSDVLKSDGTPYTVFTPYSKTWLSRLYSNTHDYLQHFPSEILTKNFISPDIDCSAKTEKFKIFTHLPSFEEIGFIADNEIVDIQKTELLKKDIIVNYHNTRNFPAIEEGTTKIGVHLRFGTISIRHAVKVALELNEVWLSELIWREFFQQIIFHFPYSADGPFKKRYGFIKWRNDEMEIERWCRGETGYPIVDAGMRELNETGFMHNRVRMIVASFLTKHLLADWRIGESYFSEKLLDYDLASNVGNWQWAAGCGCDAAPYFRVFNPWEQTKKFDPNGEYIKRWVPESLTPTYPKPIVEHTYARNRALAAYKEGLEQFAQ
jgi:deoxyribodipyrimidine photo-lyase